MPIWRQIKRDHNSKANTKIYLLFAFAFESTCAIHKTNLLQIKIIKIKFQNVGKLNLL